jgi:hypothetical protein
MKTVLNSIKARNTAICVGLSLVVVYVLSTSLSGQGRLTEPVYRVAHETSPVTTDQATPAQAVAAAPAAAAAPPTEFDLTQCPEEHPLSPVIRYCKASLEHLDKNIQDYTCTLRKRERLDDEPTVGEEQIIDLKVRHRPFSVHMSFRQPHAGRKVVWVEGQNENKLTVREAGLFSIAGRVDLHPESTTAMRGQKYPIYKIGIRNLLVELIKNFEADTKYKESEVSTNPRVEVNKRPATLIQVNHPIPRQNFRSHVVRIYFDNELRVPIYYDAYMWPAKEGDGPPMDESYAYTNLKINNGFTTREFDRENPEVFK